MSNFTTIAIMAEAGHGKDFCGQWIVANQNFVSIAFADHMKRLCNYVLEFGPIPLWGDSELRNQSMIVDWDRAEHRLTWFVDDWLHELKSLSVEEKSNYKPILKKWLDDLRIRASVVTPIGTISPRIALQLLGTEYGRAFKKDMWTSLVLDHEIPSIKSGRGYKNNIGTIPRRGKVFNGAVITDCRFISELEAVQAIGGYVIKLIRNSKKGGSITAGVADHSSELELRNIPDSVFDMVLALDDGAENVYPALQKIFDGNELTKRQTGGTPLWKP